MWIYPEQLVLRLKEKNIDKIYILFGNDICILQNCFSDILKQLNFNTYVDTIILDKQSDWNKIFYICKKLDLFIQQRILVLKFFQNYFDFNYYKNISILSSLLNKNQIVILYIYEPYLIKKKQILSIKSYFNISKTFVICETPKNQKLMKWIKNQSINMNLLLDHFSYQLLYYYYEDNLVLLKQTLQYLSWIYSGKHINFNHVKKFLIDMAHFNINHWIESILIGNEKRANRILQYLIYTGIDTKILLSKLESMILIIVHLKYYMNRHKSLHVLFKQKNIYNKYQQILFMHALKRLNMEKINQIIIFFIEIEIRYNQKYENIFKSNFMLLTMMLCSKIKQKIVFNLNNI